MVFERLRQRIIIEGTIKALRPLHVGSGRPEFEVTAIDLPIIKDVSDTPYIPGSSIKGKIRSEAERIARELGLKPEPCPAPYVNKMCGATKKGEEELCVICKIFGTATGERGGISRASKVRFRDAFPDKKPEKNEVRPGVSIDRETGSVAGGPWTVEAVPVGTTFNLEIVGENLDSEEIKLLFAAIKSVEDSALGGSSTRGFGKVKIEINRIRERGPEFYFEKKGEATHEGKDAVQSWLKGKGVDY